MAVEVPSRPLDRCSPNETPSGPKGTSRGVVECLAREDVRRERHDAEQEPDDAAGDLLDPETGAVLAELTDLDVEGTPPVELLAKVQEWQEHLDES